MAPPLIYLLFAETIDAIAFMAQIATDLISGILFTFLCINLPPNPLNLYADCH